MISLRCGMISRPQFWNLATSPCSSLITTAIFVFVHPGELPLQRQSILVVSRACEQLVFKFGDAVFPSDLVDHPVHPHGGDLVDGDKHRLAAFPRRGVVRYEILGDGSEAVWCRDTMW